MTDITKTEAKCYMGTKTVEICANKCKSTANRNTNTTLKLK